MNWVKSRVKENSIKKKQQEFFARQRNVGLRNPGIAGKQPSKGTSLDIMNIQMNNRRRKRGSCKVLNYNYLSLMTGW